MKSVEGFIAAERARLDTDARNATAPEWVVEHLQRQERALLDRLEGWVRVPRFDRQKVDALTVGGRTHLVDRRFSDHTMCGMWLPPVNRSGWMLQFMNECATCAAEFTTQVEREQGGEVDE